MVSSVYEFMHSSNYVTMAAAFILLSAIISQYLSWRFKLPSILFLILCGILLGPVSATLLPDGMKLVEGNIIFGQALSPFVSICVAIILFEGSLSLNFSKIRGVSKVVFLLTTVGIGMTVILTAMFCHYVLGFELELSFLIGGITCVSGPTVVPPLIRTVRPGKHVANILKWESIIVDPIGALIVVFIMSWFFVGTNDTAAKFIGYMLVVCLLGVSLGFVLGYFIGLSLKKHHVPEYLQSFFVLASTIVIFIISDALMHGAGLLAVTVAGIVVANMKDIKISDILSFKENLSLVIISILFIVLSADISFSLIKDYWCDLILVFLFLQFIVRPMVVAVCCYTATKLSWKEKLVMSMIYPRGIVSASVAALVVVKLTKINQSFVMEANILVFFVFMIIVFTVIFQSIFVPYFSKFLGVTEPEGKGLLIVGGNKFARELATVLVKEHDVELVITDTAWSNVQKCRQLGLNSYYGSPVSAHADWNISLVGIGTMLGLSTSEYINAIAAIKYSKEFGSNNVYVLRTPEKESYKGIGAIETNLAHLLFSDEVNYNLLAERMNQGARIKSTKITKNFSLESFFATNPEAIPLFIVDVNENVQLYDEVNRRKIKSLEFNLISLCNDSRNGN